MLDIEIRDIAAAAALVCFAGGMSALAASLNLFV